MKNTRNTVPSLLIIILLVGFPQISESIFTPILPALSSAFNIHDSVAQLTMSIYFVAFAVGVLFWGILSDTIGRRPAMLLGILCYLIGNIGLFLSPTFPWLLFFRSKRENFCSNKRCPIAISCHRTLSRRTCSNLFWLSACL